MAALPSSRPQSMAVTAENNSASTHTHGKPEAFIAVMGVTGSGKSTFISRCCEAAVGIVGDSLSSCTQECKAYTFDYKGTTVHLIDTPGFDDTRKSDTDVLKDIAGWLLVAYRDDKRLSGMVYLHSISETRMKGSHMTNLRMFQKLAGLKNMGHVILTTTMWDKTPENIGRNRENELLSTDDFWGAMVDNGSEVRRFKNDDRSALNIVGRLVDKHAKLVLSLQHEMGDDHQKLDQTSAGKALNVELNAQKEQYQKRLKEQEDEMETALKEKDMKYAQELLDTQDKINADMRRLEDNQKELKVSNEQLLKEKDEQIKKAHEQLEKMRLDAELKTQLHQDEIGKIHLRNQQNEQEVVAGAVDLVTILSQQFSNMTAEQEQELRQMQASLKAQQAQAHQSPPPPYVPFQPPTHQDQHQRPQHHYPSSPPFPQQDFPPPQQFPQQNFAPQQQYQQPIFQQPTQPMPQQQNSDWLTAAGGAAMAGVVAGGLPLVCTIM